jgi:CYTH domain-containing protein/transcriptional regulator with XRE-family HTH domain
MKNIEFGNFLYRLRKDNDLTQRFVAYQLNVSDKAVSKWETGKSQPDLEKLKLLAALYNVPLEELINGGASKKEIKVSKIVLTGGPCAGKTTALTWINNYFSQRGYSVIFVPETATELIPNGVAPWTCGTNYDYQKCQMQLQKIKEKLIEEAARTMKNNKILIVCDRGALDNKAYMTKAEFNRLLKELGTNETKERDSYDAVFHLVTAAKGKEEVYTLSNNAARTETPEKARELDDKLIASWTGHPHLRIIDNSTDFEQKLERLIKEIASFLGEPEPLEIERKFLIYYPKIKELEAMPNCTKVDIVQTYLKSVEGVERRVRARGIENDYMYYLTEKRNITPIKRIETERKLSQDEYFKLLMEADTKLHPIHKTRYCLSENNQYFEIDTYPDWDKQAIMEIELSSEDEEIKMPSFIKPIKEVTDDESYKNYQMAREMPKQLVKTKNNRRAA